MGVDYGCVEGVKTEVAVGAHECMNGCDQKCTGLKYAAYNFFVGSSKAKALVTLPRTTKFRSLAVKQKS